MMWGLDRGNVILITYIFVLLAYGPLVRSAQWRWLYAGLAVNMKVYLIGTIADNRQTVSSFITQVSKATGQLADERQNLKGALTSLQDAVQVLARFAVDNKAHLIGSVRSATSVIESLLSRRASLNEILDVMPLALQNLQKLPHKGRLPMRVNPLILAPLSDQLTDLCEQLPANLCDTLLSSLDIIGSVISPLGDIFGDLLGGGGKR